jgi:hypothetical protein
VSLVLLYQTTVLTSLVRCWIHLLLLRSTVPRENICKSSQKSLFQNEKPAHSSTLGRATHQPSMETFFENAFHLALPMSADELWSIVRVPAPGASPLRAAALAYSCHLSDHPNARMWREAAMANASATLMSAPSPSSWSWSWNNAPPPRDRILASALLARTAVLAGSASEARRWIVGACFFGSRGRA